MGDLISRQAAIDAFRKDRNSTFPRIFGHVSSYNEDDLLMDIEQLINNQPSAQPEIIRCKDCKHWGIHKRLNIPWCRYMHIDRGAEDFCSNAERRTDG